LRDLVNKNWGDLKGFLGNGEKLFLKSDAIQ
jgi:hypothetical protein